MAGVVERFDGGSAGAGGIAVGHDVDGDGGLLVALIGHAGADFRDKPLLEFGPGFDGSAADDEGVGVEGVDHDVEEEAEGVGLDLEDGAAHFIA